MKIKAMVLYTLLTLFLCDVSYAGPIVHRDGAVISSGFSLDIMDVDDGNIPAMRPAGAGFGNSPLSTDFTDVVAAGNFSATTYGSNGSVSDTELRYINTVSSNVQDQLDARCLESVFGTAIGTGLTLDETTLKTSQDIGTGASPSFVAVTEGANAVPNATDPLSFFAATTSAQLAGVLSDETGTLKSVFSDSPVFTTKITTPAITATAASLAIKPTTDAVDAVQVQDKDGNAILTVDTVSNKGIFSGAVEANSLAVTPADDPLIYFDPATASESAWWAGVNNDSEGDDDDPFEIRQSATPGSNVRLSISATGISAPGNVAGATGTFGGLSATRDISKLPFTNGDTQTEFTIANMLLYKWFSNQGDSVETDIILDNPSYPISIVCVVEEATVIEIAPPAGEAFKLDLVDLGADDCIDSPTDIGAMLTCVRMQNAAGTWIWSCYSVGSWVDTGASD